MKLSQLKSWLRTTRGIIFVLALGFATSLLFAAGHLPPQPQDFNFAWGSKVTREGSTVVEATMAKAATVDFRDESQWWAQAKDSEGEGGGQGLPSVFGALQQLQEEHKVFIWVDGDVTTIPTGLVAWWERIRAGISQEDCQMLPANSTLSVKLAWPRQTEEEMDKQNFKSRRLFSEEVEEGGATFPPFYDSDYGFMGAYEDSAYYFSTSAPALQAIVGWNKAASGGGSCGVLSTVAAANVTGPKLPPQARLTVDVWQRGMGGALGNARTGQVLGKKQVRDVHDFEVLTFRGRQTGVSLALSHHSQLRAGWRRDHFKNISLVLSNLEMELGEGLGEGGGRAKRKPGAGQLFREYEMQLARLQTTKAASAAPAAAAADDDAGGFGHPAVSPIASAVAGCGQLPTHRFGALQWPGACAEHKYFTEAPFLGHADARFVAMPAPFQPPPPECEGEECSGGEGGPRGAGRCAEGWGLRLRRVEGLDSVHRQLLRLLLAFRRLAAVAGAEWWLDWGTLLGAWRHRGFIPWDNDVDVCMLRPQLALLPPELVLWDEGGHDGDRAAGAPMLWERSPCSSSKDFDSSHNAVSGRLIDMGSGVFMDVFIYDLDAQQNVLTSSYKGVDQSPKDVIFPLGTILFENHTFPCPNQVEEKLLAFYKDLSIPWQHRAQGDEQGSYGLGGYSEDGV